MSLERAFGEFASRCLRHPKGYRTASRLSSFASAYSRCTPTTITRTATSPSLSPAPPGEQAALIAISPKTYYRPPYVGPSGWVGIDLDQIDDEGLAGHIGDAWKLVMAAQGKSPTQRKPKSLRRGPLADS